MAVTFRLTEHSVHKDTKIVEVLVDGKVAGVMYPHENKGIKIVSAHIEEKTVDKDFAGEVTTDDGIANWLPIPSVTIRFNPSPYTIVGGRIVKSPPR